jgi:hypothetical protein
MHPLVLRIPAASHALYGHVLCFAAQEARRGGTVVDVTDFRQRAEEDADSLRASFARQNACFGCLSFREKESKCLE